MTSFPEQMWRVVFTACIVYSLPLLLPLFLDQCAEWLPCAGYNGSGRPAYTISHTHIHTHTQSQTHTITQSHKHTCSPDLHHVARCSCVCLQDAFKDSWVRAPYETVSGWLQQTKPVTGAFVSNFAAPWVRASHRNVSDGWLCQI